MGLHCLALEAPGKEGVKVVAPLDWGALEGVKVWEEAKASDERLRMGHVDFRGGSKGRLKKQKQKQKEVN